MASLADYFASDYGEGPAARIRRRYPTREPDPVSMAATKMSIGQWLAGPSSRESAASLFYGGDYDPRPVLMDALGLVGAPAVGLTREAASLGSGAIRPGIRAYHSSPHDFDVFDMSKIGTGQGAQSYGHGLYFAENPEVAAAYRREFNGRAGRSSGPEDLARRMLDAHGGDREGAIAELERRLDASMPELRREDFLKNSSIPGAIEALKSEKPLGARTYDVNIRADPKDFVDWEKLSPAAQRELKNPESVRRLAEAGYPGIRYPDKGSREGGSSTYNYVLFRDDIIDVLKKYGILGGGILGGAGKYEEND